MRSDARLLVIGPPPFRDEINRLLPHCKSLGTDNALTAVWQAGQEPFDAVLVSLATGRNVLKAVRSLRHLAPQARIVAVCAAAEEPGARHAQQEGADDYLIEPFSAADLHQALHLPVPRLASPGTPNAGPTWQERVQMVEVLQNLGEGPRAALERLASMLRDVFDVDCVSIEIDGLTVATGEPGPAGLEAPILRQETPVGSIALGRCRRGAFTHASSTHLTNYARLVEALVTVASDRVRWQDLAWTDDLSRLRNRRYFEQRLDELIAQCTRQHAYLTVLLFDIDDFKRYNDQFGHETGDALIREVAFLLVRCARESDVVARYGGDEFAVIFWDAEKPRVPGSRHPSQLLPLAERYRQAIGTHTFKCLGPQAPGPVTISGGLACFPWDGRSREQLVRAADEALRTAKHTGKNRIELAGDPALAGSDRPAPSS